MNRQRGLHRLQKAYFIFVIPNEVRNLSLIYSQERRDSSARGAPRNDKNLSFSGAYSANLGFRFVSHKRRKGLTIARPVDQFGTRTTVSDLTISTQRAGRFSCGATSRNGPRAPGMGAPSSVSATMISESIKLELNSSSEKTTR